jgi:pheromone shutdown protein TraB
MGHSAKTLREMYERCTPEEKLRPIFEAIDRLLFDDLDEPPAAAKPDEPAKSRLVAELRRLSPEERQQIFQMLEET